MNLGKANQPVVRRKNKNKKAKKPKQSRIRVVTVPVAKGKIIRGSEPRMRSLPNGDCIVEHKEYLQEIAGSIAFAANTIPVNPGLPGSFPWLSAIAQRYESYIFEKLDYCFETESSSSTTGALFMAIDYDATDVAPSTKTQVLAYKGHTRSPPWNSCKLLSAKGDLQKRKTYYVRNGAAAANQDIRVFDTGNLFVCTSGQASTANVGEIHAEYRIRFMTPQIGAVGLGQAVSGKFAGTTNAAPGATVTGNLPATLVSSGTTTSLNTWTFSQPWEGLVTTILIGTGFTAVTQSGTATIVEVSDVVNTANTNNIEVCTVIADIGQTFILSVPNTTISNSQFDFAQFDV